MRRLTAFNSLKINGKKYEHEELISFCKANLDSTETDHWKKELFTFILTWIDPQKSHVEVMTSGSTGAPKTIRISKETMIASAKNTLDYLGLEPEDTALLCLPVQYIGGKMMVVRSFVGQLNLVPVSPTSDPLKKFTGKSASIDFAAMTPMQAYAATQSSSSLKKFNAIKTIILGGGAVSSILAEKLKDCQNRIFETYGMTETVSHVAMRSIVPRKSDCFEALPGILFETEERDCLVIHSNSLGLPKIVTNDIVQLIDQNRFSLTGRWDHVINSGGIKIHPEKIEASISHLVKERFIIGHEPDPSLGQKLVLVIEGEPYPVEAEKKLKQAILKTVGSLQSPKKIRYLSLFPETANGKLIREMINAAK